MKYLFLLLMLFGCNPTEIPDAEFCADAGPNGARCFHTLAKDKDRVIPKEVWDRISQKPVIQTPEAMAAYNAARTEERYSQICGQPEAFAAIKAALEKLCQKVHDCTYVDATAVFFSKVQNRPTAPVNTRPVNH